MKKNILLLFMLLGGTSIFSNEKINTPYEFPVRPGMTEWSIFKNGEEMVKACQIPDSILRKLTTKALLETCLSYPLKYDYISNNSVIEGISNTIKNFNGYHELSLRMDAPEELIKAYENIPILDRNTRINTVQENVAKVSFMELLMSNDIFLKRFTEVNLSKLKATVLKKYELKTEALEIYGLFNIKSSILLGAKILENSESNSNDKKTLSEFIKEFESASPTLIENSSKIIIK